jgi:uncharacterized membrane protein
MIQTLVDRSSIPAADSFDWPRWLLALALVLCLAALISIWIGRHHSAASKILWTFVVILIPILGPIAWFALGWERRE